MNASRPLDIVRLVAGTVIWSAWLFGFGCVIWYDHAHLGPLLKDCAFLAVYAWLLLMDDPPASYSSWSAWRADRTARLARRKGWFRPLPSRS